MVGCSAGWRRFFSPAQGGCCEPPSVAAGRCVRSQRRWNWAAFSRLAPTILINPYGLELPRLWMAVLNLPLGDLIQEHGPLWRSGGTAVMVVGLGAIYVVALLGTRTGHGLFTVPKFWLRRPMPTRRASENKWLPGRR